MKSVTLNINYILSLGLFGFLQTDKLKTRHSIFFKLFGLSLFLFVSCKERGGDEFESTKKEKTSIQKKISVKESIAISQLWTKDEAYKIKRFVERRNWNAKRTETGIYYYVHVVNEQGRKAKAGDVAVIEYKVRLLDADTTLCYSSEKGKTEDVVIEMDNVETGLHEALTYLRVGEQAYVIIPHYLAYGLAGDLEKIPPLSPVLYEINLIQLK